MPTGRASGGDYSSRPTAFKASSGSEYISMRVSLPSRIWAERVRHDRYCSLKSTGLERSFVPAGLEALNSATYP